MALSGSNNYQKTWTQWFTAIGLVQVIMIFSNLAGTHANLQNVQMQLLLCCNVYIEKNDQNKVYFDT